MSIFRKFLIAMSFFAGIFFPQFAFADTWEELRDQGILYYNRNNYTLAYSNLSKAYNGGGRNDFETALGLTRTARAILLLEVAEGVGQKALELAANDSEKKAKVLEIVNELKGTFGTITVEAGPEQSLERGVIEIENTTGIINKEKKQVFMSIRERFRSGEVELPATVYLPPGDYTVNNVPVTVVSTAEAEKPDGEKGDKTIYVYFSTPLPTEPEGPWPRALTIGLVSGAVALLGASIYIYTQDDDSSGPIRRSNIRLNP